MYPSISKRDLQKKIEAIMEDQSKSNWNTFGYPEHSETYVQFSDSVVEEPTAVDVEDSTSAPSEEQEVKEISSSDFKLFRFDKKDNPHFADLSATHIDIVKDNLYVHPAFPELFFLNDKYSYWGRSVVSKYFDFKILKLDHNRLIDHNEYWSRGKNVTHYLTTIGTTHTAAGCCGVLVLAENKKILKEFQGEKGKNFFNLVFTKYATIQIYDQIGNKLELSRLLNPLFKDYKIVDLPKNPKGSKLISIQLTKDNLK